MDIDLSRGYNLQFAAHVQFFSSSVKYVLQVGLRVFLK